MKLFFASVFAILVVLSITAWQIQPNTEVKGKTSLLWVSDDNPARRDQITLFNKMYPEYNMTLDPSNTGMEKVIVQSLAGAGPDVFDCYNGFQLTAFVKSGIAWDVTDELTKRGVNIKKDVWPAIQPLIFLDGRAYGMGTNVSVDCMWLNKDIFAAAGVPLPRGPWTWDQFVPLAQKLTRRDANGRIIQYGALIDMSANWLQFVMQWGGNLYSEDGTRCVLNTPEAIQGLQYMHDLIYKYHVTPSPVEEQAATSGGWGSGTITFFSAGKGAMALGGRWWLCTLRQSTNKLSLGVCEAPHGTYRIFRGYGKSTLINKNSPNRQKALDFLLYETSQQYNELINHQADGLGPIIKDSYTDKFLHDKEFPEEDCNAVWRESMQYAVPEQVSPFVNGQAASRILTKQIDLIKNNQKSVPDALHTAQDQINEEITKTIARDPSLRARYEALMRKGGAR